MSFEMKKLACAVSLLTLIGLSTIPASAKDNQQPTQELVDADASKSRLIESAFSPEAGGEALVLKVINSAQYELRLAAYSFTSPTVTKALIAAKKRGVDVLVVVDEERNRGPANLSVLTRLANAGIPVRTNAFYALHHDKYIIVDGRHVQNGSFNYTAGAAKSNSENVLVIWNDANLAASFLKHWQSRWEQGIKFESAS